MKINKINKKKGFTLIELLIVIAIIAILAAIAIPQFAAYRIRGYNAAATSDLRNMKIAIEAFKNDYQVYCPTDTPTVDLQSNGLVKAGPMTFSQNVAAGGIVSVPPLPRTATVFAFGISNGVSADVNTGIGGNSYTAGTSHVSGDAVYAGDSDITQIKQKILPKVVGTAMVDGEIPASVINIDNLQTADWANL